MIQIEGARVHNLKNINVQIPRNSLTVITGLSGSGKSSLAFDTIFAEGQRRYIETFSAYTRNFLGGMQRPDVDKISGLSPVISIEQKTTNKNPRSTVGTVTEIYDFFRLLYSRVSDAYSYHTGEKMQKYTDEDVMRLLISQYSGQRIYLLAPVVANRKGHYRELFESILKKGFLHARIDGAITEITEGLMLDRYKNHNIEVVIDKLAISSKEDERLRHSLEIAMKMGDGQIMVVDKDSTTIKHYSRHLMCPTTGLCYRDPSPHSFSFNSPLGACPHCKGLGLVPAVDIDNLDYSSMAAEYQSLNIEGQKEWAQQWADSIDSLIPCPECQGARLNKEALHFRIDGKNIDEVSHMELSELYNWVQHVETTLDNNRRLIAHEIIKEITTRLRFLLDVGLHYLTLSRSSVSLSGGESQRIRLATQIGTKLVNVLYILDEPSIGLHQRDNMQLITSLKHLRDEGNTVIVVEHDQDMMQQADCVRDMGPKA